MEAAGRAELLPLPSAERSRGSVELGDGLLALDVEGESGGAALEFAVATEAELGGSLVSAGPAATAAAVADGSFGSLVFLDTAIAQINTPLPRPIIPPATIPAMSFLRDGSERGTTEEDNGGNA